MNVRKADLALGCALLVVVLFTWMPRFAGPLDLRWDGGVYYVLGTSLAQTGEYRLLNEPGEIRATQYPPLFPAIIALHQLVLGTDDPTGVGRALRWTFLALSLAIALVCYGLLRGYVGPGMAFLGACVLMLHTTTVFVSDIAFAELPFMLATLLFFLVCRRVTTRKGEIAAGFLAVGAFLLRTAGMALIAAWVLDALIRRRPRQAALQLAMTLPVVLGWQLYIASVERSPSYAETSYEYQRADYLFYNVSYGRNVTLADPRDPDAGRLSAYGLAQRAARNLTTAPRRAGETISFGREELRRLVGRAREIPMVGGVVRPRLAVVGVTMLGWLVLLGFAAQIRRGEYTMPLYGLFYVGLISLTPWTSSERYWVPVAPMMIVAVIHLVTTAGEIMHRRGPRFALAWGRSLALTGVAAVVIAQCITLTDFFRERHQPVRYLDRRGDEVSYRLFYYRDTYRGLDAALDRLRTEAEPTDIVAASMPHWVYLRTGLKSVKPPFVKDPVMALALLESVPVDHLLVDGRSRSFTRVFALPAVQQAPERWQSVYVDEPGEVAAFRRRPPEAGLACRFGETPHPTAGGSGCTVDPPDEPSVVEWPRTDGPTPRGDLAR